MLHVSTKASCPNYIFKFVQQSSSYHTIYIEESKCLLDHLTHQIAQSHINKLTINKNELHREYRLISNPWQLTNPTTCQTPLNNSQTSTASSPSMFPFATSPNSAPEWIPFKASCPIPSNPTLSSLTTK